MQPIRPPSIRHKSDAFVWCKNVHSHVKTRSNVCTITHLQQQIVIFYDYKNCKIRDISFQITNVPYYKYEITQLQEIYDIHMRLFYMKKLYLLSTINQQGTRAWPCSTLYIKVFVWIDAQSNARFQHPSALYQDRSILSRPFGPSCGFGLQKSLA